MKVTRICAGEYKVTDGERSVSISCNDYWDGPGWIAVADWDSKRYTDPLPLKRDAVQAAKAMLEKPGE